MESIQELMDDKEFRTFAHKPDSQDVLEKEKAIIHYISTNDKDWGDDVVDQNGMDASVFKNYQTVFFNHDYNRPIASNMWLNTDEKGKLAKTRFSKTNMFADDIYNLHKENILRTWSVGFRPKIKNGKVVDGAISYDEKTNKTTFHLTELIEYSSAPLAMNPYTLDQAKSIIKSMEGKGWIDILTIQKDVTAQLEEFNKQLAEVSELKKQLEDLIKLNTTEKIELLEKNILDLTEKIENKLEIKAETLGTEKTAQIIRSVVAGEVSKRKSRQLN